MGPCGSQERLQAELRQGRVVSSALGEKKHMAEPPLPSTLVFYPPRSPALRLGGNEIDPGEQCQ